MKKLRLVLFVVLSVVMLFGAAGAWAGSGPGTVTGGPEVTYLPIKPEHAKTPWPEGLVPVFAGEIGGASDFEEAVICYPVPMNWGYLVIKFWDENLGEWVTLPQEIVISEGNWPIVCARVNHPGQVALFGKSLMAPPASPPYSEGDVLIPGGDS